MLIIRLFVIWYVTIELVEHDTLVFRSSIALGPTRAKIFGMKKKKSWEWLFSALLERVHVFIVSVIFFIAYLVRTPIVSLDMHNQFAHSKKWKTNGMQIGRYESHKDGNSDDNEYEAMIMMMMKAKYWQQRDKINMRHRLIGPCDSYKWINSVCLHLQTCSVFVFFFLVTWTLNEYAAITSSNGCLLFRRIHLWRNVWWM